MLFNIDMQAQIQFSPEFRKILKRPSADLLVEFRPDHNSIKHWIEFFSVPHTEVGAVWVQEKEVDFSYQPKAGDRIEVHSLLGPVDVTKPSRLRPEPFRAQHFIVDECVANLAPKLRMLGCDAIADRRWDDKQIAEISAQEKRILLTRDRGLLKRKEAVWGYFLRSTDPKEQIREVIQFFGLSTDLKAFSRCMACNGILQEIEKSAILDQLEPKTRLYFKDFSQCSSCGKIYWEGCHFEKMQKTLLEMTFQKA
jgi:uncharacterized protein with PIN domain